MQQESVLLHPIIIATAKKGLAVTGETPAGERGIAMEEKAFCRSAYHMIALVCCALKGKKPSAALIGKLDLSALFEVCERHNLTACTAYALESAGVHDRNFTEAKNKAIRKNILLDTERKRILDRLEAEGIWYMPLKGAILKDWYPKLGMRQMSDNDILYDVSARSRIREIMTEMGFSCERYGVGHNDPYHKPPVFNFEMHHILFSAVSDKKIFGYYENIKDKLCRDENKQYAYHFRQEDFYIYVTAHEHKHFIRGGTGVRTLADTYVILQKFGKKYDWDYIHAELRKLGIAEFESQNRALAEKVFSGLQLSKEEKALLRYYIMSGTYGTQTNQFRNNLKEADNSKFRYYLHRLFPPLNFVKVYYPFFYRHKWLLPVMWVFRPVKGLFVNREKLRNEFDTLFRKKKA